MKLGNALLALELYQKAIEANPHGKQVGNVLLQMGIISELNLQKKERAELYYEELLQDKTESNERLEALKRLSNLYFEENKEAKRSVALLEELLAHRPPVEDRDALFFKKAKAEISQTNFGQARKDLESLLSEFPQSTFSPSAELVRAETYFFEGDHKKAEQELLEVAKRYSNQEQAWEADFLRAQCLETDQRYKEALKVYEGLKNKYPNPQVLQDRIRVLRKRMQKSK